MYGIGIWDKDGVETEVINRLIYFENKRVLEIGCGDGRMTTRFAGTTASVLAVDPSEAAIRKAQEYIPDSLRSRIVFTCDDVLTMGLDDSEFDVVVLSWSL